MRLLIIEDSSLVAESLRRGLKDVYAVDMAINGDDGIAQIDSHAYDLVLLDLNLPDMSGLEVCKLLRRKGLTVPILIVTGSDSLQDKVQLLDAGADDYLTKPFNLEEVRARIRSALRRVSVDPSSPILVIKGLELDPATRLVRRNQRPVTLRRKEFDILEYLMRNPGKTVTRAMIVGHIWDMNENLWANVVDVHIKHLRDKIDRPFGSQLIKTVHGVGYKLEAS